jgi:antitoxin component of RelBE/YafQ-DinJ toxin-antitoxin module
MKKKNKESVIRARVEDTLKNEFEAWCVARDISVSQAIRALLRHHLHQSTDFLDFMSARSKGGKP